MGVGAAASTLVTPAWLEEAQCCYPMMNVALGRISSGR